MQLTLARALGLATAAVENRAGRFVLPSPAAIETAAEESARVERLEPDALTELPGEGSYPIVGYSHMVFLDRPGHRPKEEAVTRFMLWSLDRGQAMAAGLDHPRLPPAIVSQARAHLDGVLAR